MSRYYVGHDFIPTLREDPADAEVVSHKLLLRAGIHSATVRRNLFVSATRSARRCKSDAELREEMNRVGGQEFYLPALHPAESGRSRAVGAPSIACVHNAGRSQIAAAWFNELADPLKARAISAGTDPGPRVHPEVMTAMREVGIDLMGASTTRLTAELAQQAQWLVTMGCGDECPYVPGAKRDDWPLEDPKGKAITRVREIRDEIRDRVQALIEHEGWSRA